jgi:hypothetical protein
MNSLLPELDNNSLWIARNDIPPTIKQGEVARVVTVDKGRVSAQHSRLGVIDWPEKSFREYFEPAPKPR